VSTGIEWTDESWNPVTGCDRVSLGCDNCYAERMAKRFGKPFIGAVELHPERLDAPLLWRKPKRVFVNSVSDLFHEDVPDDFIAQVFAVMSIAEKHSFQVLTKRPQRMARLLNDEAFRLAWFTFRNDRAVEPDVQRMAARGDTSLRMEWPCPNVWLGVSVETQQYANIRIPHLLRTPAATRFLSVEPLLGPVDLAAFLATPDPSPVPDGAHRGPGIGWVIVGGESGPGARPMQPEWVRRVRDDCTNASVPFFFKQWGEWGIGGWRVGVTDGQLVRMGKRNAGAELDGRRWVEYPE